MEIELQYVVADGIQPTVPVELAGLTLARCESVAVTDTYFDTEDLELRKAGCSLRVRVTDRDPTPQLTWKGRAHRRRGNGRVRSEIELPLESFPDTPDELARLLARHGIDDLVTEAVGAALIGELRPIGRLSNQRSRHTYVQGLHRLEVTWDRLEFPVGPEEVRVEVEVKSRHAARHLDLADAELRELFGDALRPARRGKVRELCERLYPELMAAARA